ncbi:MAG: hypothetical protein KBS96_04455 [Lachnospiraceae bacterium]|nr:hypothetical protein [Candidatus Colinaster scatohippi]
MSGIVEIKAAIQRFYSKNEVYINPILKFLLALVVFAVINNKMGYMERLDSITVVLVVALLCSFMPMTIMALLAGMFILLHMYALAMEMALVTAVVLFLMFLLYIRFVPNETVVILLTPILFMLKIPYVLPIAVGLFGGPVSIISIGCGVAISHLIAFTSENATTIATIDDGNMVSRIRYIVDGMIGDKAMFVTIAIFCFTLIIVYLLRRLSVDYSWTIAIGAGVVVEMVLLLICDLIFDLNFSIIGIILGSILSAAVGLFLQLFSFHLDYKKTEKLQFEDEDYYYYVKAVPKVTVAMPNRRVKKINTARSDRGSSRSTGARASAGGQTRTVHTANGATRTIKK